MFIYWTRKFESLKVRSLKVLVQGTYISVFKFRWNVRKCFKLKVNNYAVHECTHIYEQHTNCCNFFLSAWEKNKLINGKFTIISVTSSVVRSIRTAQWRSSRELAIVVSIHWQYTQWYSFNDSTKRRRGVSEERFVNTCLSSRARVEHDDIIIAVALDSITLGKHNKMLNDHSLQQQLRTDNMNIKTFVFIAFVLIIFLRVV